MSTHEKLIVALEWRINNHTSFFSDDDLTAMQRAAAALRELLNEREEYQQAVTALDESMKHVPVNEQLIKLNIELGTAKLEIRELRAKLEKAEEAKAKLAIIFCDVIKLEQLEERGGEEYYRMEFSDGYFVTRPDIDRCLDAWIERAALKEGK